MIRLTALLGVLAAGFLLFYGFARTPSPAPAPLQRTSFSPAGVTPLSPMPPTLMAWDKSGDSVATGALRSTWWEMHDER